MFFRFFSLLLIFPIIFSSCGGGGGQKREKVVINVWNLFDDENVLKGQIQEFESKNPGVKIKYKKFNDPKFYEEVLINEFAEGNGPDIFTLKNTKIQENIGKIAPFDKKMSNIPFNGAVFKETFLAVCSKDLVSNGKIYGMPLFVDNLAIYYNSSYFEDTFPSGKPGKTWDEILDQVSKLNYTDNSLEGFSLSGISMGKSENIERAVDIFYLLALQNGAKFYDEKMKKIILNKAFGRNKETGEQNKPTKEALKFYTSFGKPSFKNYSWNSGMTARFSEKSEVYPFITGKTAMIFGYSYLQKTLESKILQFKKLGKKTISKSDIKIAQIPQRQAFSKSKKKDALANYFPLFVSKNSKNKKVAWNFLLSLATKKSLTDYFEKTNKVSSRIDLIKDQVLDPQFGVFAKQAVYSKSFPDLVLNDEKYREIFKKVIEKVSKSKQTPETALKNAEKILRCLLKKELKKEENLGLNCLQNGKILR